jgi:hypothetical protein
LGIGNLKIYIMPVVDIQEYDDSTIELKEPSYSTLPSPSKVHQKKMNEISDGGNNSDDSDSCCGGLIGAVFWAISIFFILLTFPISIFMCIRIIQEYERAVIFRLGRIKKNGTVGPGLFFIVPCVDTVSFLRLN